MNGTWTATVGTQRIDLPIIEIADGGTIALFMSIDVPIAFLDRASLELAEALRPSRPELVVTAATLGIPIAVGVARALGHERYLALQKSRKWHLRDSPSVSVNSITTVVPQTLTLDERFTPLVRGRRVAFVDDVVSSGSSVAAALELLRAQGADVVAIGALFTEGEAWRARLGDDVRHVTALGELPLNPRG